MRNRVLVVLIIACLLTPIFKRPASANEILQYLSKSVELCLEATPPLKTVLCRPRGIRSLADAVTRCLFGKHQTGQCHVSYGLPTDPEKLLEVLIEAGRKSTDFRSAFGNAMRYRAQRRFSRLRHCRLRREFGIACRARVESNYDEQIAVFDLLTDSFPIPKTTQNLRVLASAAAKCHLDGREKEDCEMFFVPFAPDEFVERASKTYPRFKDRYDEILKEHLENRVSVIARASVAIELGSRNPHEKNFPDEPSIAQAKMRFDAFGGFERFATQFDHFRERSFDFHMRAIARCKAGKSVVIYECSEETAKQRRDALQMIFSEYPAMETLYQDEVRSHLDD